MGVPANRAAVLVHVRASVDQVGLSRAQRAANVAGTLAARPLPPGTVVLVDDVTTTGATLVEAARSLRAVGADRLGAATVTWAGPGRHLASGPGRD
jgi:predicted amidophosphoribosyltransferase